MFLPSFWQLTMFGNKYPLIVLIILFYQAIPLKADEPGSITRISVPLNLNISEGQSQYHIGFLSFTFSVNDLKIQRSENPDSVKLLITNAQLLVLQGKTRSPSRPEYDIGPNGAFFLLESKGTAQISPNGNRIQSCQFVFVENEDAKVSELKEVAKQGILKILSDYLGPALCDNINEYHFDGMNLL